MTTSLRARRSFIVPRPDAAAGEAEGRRLGDGRTREIALPRRRIVAACIAVAASAAAPGAVLAQEWPSQPITIIVPFPPGGSTYALARLLGEKLAQGLGQEVVVESKPGANATFGAHFVATAPPDGYTLFIASAHHAVAPAVLQRLPYDLQKDFAPIATLAVVPNMIVVNASSSVASVADLVALAKAQPNQLTYGTAGRATVHNVIGAQFASQAKVQLKHAAYSGSAAMVAALLGKEVALTFDSVPPSLPHIRAGRLKALAVTTAKRTPALPDVPTMQEAGFKDFDFGTWFGLMAPAATPKDIVARLHAETLKALQAPDFRKRLEDIGAQPIGNSPDEFARQIRDDIVRFERIAKQLRIVVE